MSRVNAKIYDDSTNFVILKTEKAFVSPKFR